METELNTATTEKIDESFNLGYEDETGKLWRFKRTKNPRAFVREDGLKLSHTHVLFNYEYKGRVHYKASTLKFKTCPACFMVFAPKSAHVCPPAPEVNHDNG